VRTYANRPNKNEADWSADPVQAARLGLASEVKTSLVALTTRYQAAPSGLAQFTIPQEFYVEQVGVVADALQNGLVQDYDDLLRIAPAWPRDWSVDGSVSIAHGGRVYVQADNGEVITIGIKAGNAQDLRVRNPWPGRSVRVAEAGSGTVVKLSAEAIFTIPMQSGKVYLIERSSETPGNLKFSPISGMAASVPRRLGSRSIGLEKPSK
jgi:alpha-L-fucosidase 2